MKSLNHPAFHGALVVVGLVLDQVTKLWAIARFSDGAGHSSGMSIPVLGDLLRFQLDFNEGAAFSSRPQQLMPWLPPTFFFALLTILAVAALALFYRRIPVQDLFSRVGVALIASGAFGNLTDRFHLGKVVDFISVDFPDFLMPRWPTFNVADSLVCLGVGLVLLSPVLTRKLKLSTEGKE